MTPAAAPTCAGPADSSAVCRCALHCTTTLVSLPPCNERPANVFPWHDIQISSSALSHNVFSQVPIRKQALEGRPTAAAAAASALAKCYCFHHSRKRPKLTLPVPSSSSCWMAACSCCPASGLPRSRHRAADTTGDSEAVSACSVVAGPAASRARVAVVHVALNCRRLGTHKADEGSQLQLTP